MNDGNLTDRIIEEARKVGLDHLMTRNRAQKGIQTFRERFSTLSNWKKQLGITALRQRYITTHFGRKIPFTKGEYSAPCYWAQGTEVELMLHLIIALGAKLKADFPETHIKMFLHDELILETPKEDAHAVAELLRTAMEKVFIWRFPQAPLINLLDIHINECWGNLK